MVGWLRLGVSVVYSVRSGPGYVSRFGVSLSVGPTEEVESGDQLQAGLGPASVIHEPSRRRAEEKISRGRAGDEGLLAGRGPYQC